MDNTLQTKTLESGNVSPVDGLRDFFESLITSTEIKRGIVRVESPSLCGTLGLFCSRYLVGARIDGGLVTGFEAARRVMALREGTYTFSEASADDMSLLKTSLAVDILSLLDWAAPDSKTPPPLDQALAGVVESYARTMSGDESTVTEPRKGPPPLRKPPVPPPAPVPVPLEQSPSFVAEPNSYISEPCSYVPDEPPVPDYSPWQQPTYFSSANAAEMAAGQYVPEQFPASDQSVETDALSEESEKSEFLDNLSLYADISEPAVLYTLTETQRAELDSIPSPMGGPSYTDPGFSAQELDSIPTPDPSAQNQNLEDEWVPFSGAPVPKSQTNQEEDEWWTKKRLRPMNDHERYQVGEIYRDHHRTQSARDFLQATKAKPAGEGSNASDGPVKFLHKEGKTLTTRLKIVLAMTVVCSILGGFGVFHLVRSRGQSTDLIERGLTHLNRGEKLSALLEFDEAVKLSPDNAKAYMHRAETRVLFNDADNALADFARARQLDAKLRGAYIGAARTLLSRDDYSEALALLNHCLSVDPDCADAHALRAVAFALTGKHVEAMSEANKAISLDPNAPVETYRARALACWKSGKYEDAIKDYTKAIDMQAGDTRTYVGRGSCYLAVGNADKAIEDLTQAISLDNTHASAYVARGKAYRKKGDFAHATADFALALQLQPRSAEAFAARGTMYMDLKKYGEAIAEFDKALSLQPDRPDVEEQRTLAYTHVKRVKPVMINWLADDEEEEQSSRPRPAVGSKGGPKFEPALVRQKLDPEVTRLTDVLKTSPNDTKARRQLAYALMRSQNVVAAAEQFQILDKAYCLSAQDKFAYGEMLEQAGALTRSASVYRALLQKNPYNTVLREKLRKVMEQLAAEEDLR